LGFLFLLPSLPKLDPINLASLRVYRKYKLLYFLGNRSQIQTIQTTVMYIRLILMGKIRSYSILTVFLIIAFAHSLLWNSVNSSCTRLTSLTILSRCTVENILKAFMCLALSSIASLTCRSAAFSSRISLSKSSVANLMFSSNNFNFDLIKDILLVYF